MHLTRFVLIVYAFSSKNERYAFRFYYITHSEVTIFLDGSIFVHFLWLETDVFPSEEMQSTEGLILHYSMMVSFLKQLLSSGFPQDGFGL